MNTFPLQKKIFIFFIGFISVNLYKLIIIPQSTLIGITFLSSLALILVYIFIITYSNETSQNPYRTIKTEVNIILISLLLSMLPATVYHNQNPLTTLFAQHNLYFIIFYYLLHQYQPSEKLIIKLFTVIAIAYLFIFIVQYAVFPTLILKARVGRDRGTIRIFFNGNLYALLAYFYFLNKTLKEQLKISYIIYLLFAFIVLGILPGTRQELASITLCTGLFVLFSKRIKNRAAIIFLMIIAGISIFFIFYDIFIQLIMLSKEQKTGHDEGARLRAIRFFLTEFMPSKLAYITGNGADHGSSAYGRKIIFYKNFRGFFQSDIGIIGDYTKYGALFVIGAITILLKGIFMKVPDHLAYIKFFYLKILLTFFTGSGFFTTKEGLVLTALIFYLVDLSKFKNVKQVLTKEKPDIPEEEYENNPILYNSNFKTN